ncbi:MAG: preprotein translocase subunit SecG [Methylobacterium frigidaeris]
MQTVLIVVHLIIVLALIAVVLLQRSEGGLGLGGGGGTQGFMTGRGQANALTRATAILAALFFATSMVLAIMSHRGAAPRSIFEGTGQPGAPAQPGNQPAGNLLDQLRQQQGGSPAPAAPAPAAPTPAPAPAAPEAPQSR